MRGVSGAGIGWRKAVQPPWGTVHIIGTGQSLSVGLLQAPVSTTQPFSNGKLFDPTGAYDVNNPNFASLQIVPLVAPQRPQSNSTQPYPQNIQQLPFGGESPEIAACNQITRLMAAAGLTYKFVASATGESSMPMSVIQKNGSGNAYQAGLFECAAFKRIAAGSFGVGAVMLWHGESDASLFTSQASYAASLIQLQANYQADCSAITGQSRLIPLIMSQQNADPPGFSGFNTTAIAMLQVAQAYATQSKLVLTGPKYQYPYASGDFQHLANYLQTGEKYAQVYRAIDQFGLWQPLWPIGFSRSGTTVTITFHVPVGPLLFDGGHTAPHLSGGLSLWSPGNGFEAYDAPIAIATCTGNGVSPIVVGLASPHGASNGQTWVFTGVQGNNAANAAWPVTVVDPTHLSLNGSTGNGAMVGTTGQAFAPIGIASTPVISGNQVTLTLSRTPMASPFYVGYAHTPDTAYGNYTGGFGTGRCGLLRDSDPYTGPSGFLNSNWCVEFAQAMN